MADSTSIRAALIGRLSADAALKATLPDGVYYDIAKDGATRFAILSLFTHVQDPIFQETGWEVFVYLVKAVTQNVSSADSVAGAQRIYTLLHNQPLNAAGYADMRCQRIRHIDYSDVDEVSNLRWQHAGGHYEIWVQPLTQPK